MIGRNGSQLLPPTGALARGARRLAPALVAAALASTAIFAQDADGDISRAPTGRILHRRTLEPGDAPVADTPVFVYEPGDSGRGVPKDLVRDGVTLARPSASTAPEDGELIHTADGLAKPPPPDRPPQPLPPAGPGTVDDPSAPLGAGGGDASPSEAPPQLAPAESDAIPTDPDALAAGTPIEGDGDVSPSAALAPDGGPADGAPGGVNSDGPDPRAPDPREGLGSEARPDRDTEREGTLHYNEVFDPSVVPFKRNRALDEVGDDYTLRVSSGRFEHLEPTGNKLERGREVFWGSLLLEGAAGQRIAMPSVSPEGRILSYQATPTQDVRFERDAAGNFYATPSLDGRLRLVFVTDAPSHWFGRSLPAGARFDQVPRALRPKMPKAIQKEALEVAAAIGIDASTSYSDALSTLVAWFRAFEPGVPPPAQGSVYRDIALGKKGICRHRGHGFVITAQALGIPAHYVFNEAHVFVEVWIPGPDAGWLRVDLGGGADELQVHGAEGKSLHQPIVGDPFDKPPAYAESGAAGAMKVEGMPEEDPGSAAGLGPTAPDAELLDLPIVRARPQPTLEPTRTSLVVGESLVFRGDAFHVSGAVVAVRGGAPIAQGTVQILLTRGPDKQAVALLGTATIAGGRYAVDVAIPPRQVPGNYEIVAEYVGDGTFAPSVGE